MSDVVVSCAGDTDLAKRLYDYLVSAYLSATDTWMISINEDEITIQSKELGIKNDVVRKSLSEFQASNADLVGYSITEFEHVFTIGIRHSLEEVILSCDMCGYLARYEEQMIQHKKIHWPIPTY